jgi:hypothetical protein
MAEMSVRVESGSITNTPALAPALVSATRGPAFITGLALASGTVQIVAAPGAGLSIHVTSITVTNASGTAGKVSLKDGTTDRLNFPVPATNASGMSMTLDPPWKLAANAALQASSDTATAASVNVQFYVAA